MAKHGKRVRANEAKLEPLKRYSFDEAIALLQSMQRAKFDETVECALTLGVDPKHADQMVRGACVLPHGVGKTVRVLVFAKGEKENEAKAAGADFVGGEDLAKKIQEGWFEFDKVIAAPDMMGVVGRIGKILGPRGLMPNPKVGTVTTEIGKAVTETKAGKIEFRVDKAGIVHAPVAKIAMPAQKVKENLFALCERVMRLKPASAKGIYLKNASLTSTMGPGIRLDLAEVAATGGPTT